MRKYIDLIESDNQEKNKAFEHLADLQRGEPEMQMLRCQSAIGGGVMAVMVEHMGDIIHRMSEMPDHIPNCGYEFVNPKVKRCINYLSNEYGFEREFNENIESNAKYRIEYDNSNETSKQLEARIIRELYLFAEEHMKLPVYNEAQWLARQACYFLGMLKFNDSLECLYKLNSHLNSPQEWDKFASPYDANYSRPQKT